MALKGRASGSGSLRVRTTGGARLEKFIANAGDAEKLAAVAGRVLRRRMLPVLRRRVPEDTGALKESLRIRQVGEELSLRGISYAPDVRWSESGQVRSVSKAAGRILKRQHRAIGRDISKGLLT